MKTLTKEFWFAILSWTTIIAQFVLLLEARMTSVIEAVFRFFTFFTILTNILVAIVFTALWLKPKNKFSFFTRFNTISATAVYIFVVGFVYNTVLRFIWEPQGLQRIVDEMLHLIIPIVFITYWMYNIKSNSIQWKSIFNWLMYPMIYLVVILIRGHFADYYPYPFVNVLELGYSKVILNSLLLTLFFGLISSVVIGVVRYRNK
ncbi:MAG: Pr6Pr family membrane protein [Flavobacteriales bacterium]|nr:Pr6Pr family membrane protein [Flavobacteriales bacterium]